MDDRHARHRYVIGETIVNLWAVVAALIIVIGVLLGNAAFVGEYLAYLVAVYALWVGGGKVVAALTPDDS